MNQIVFFLQRASILNHIYIAPSYFKGATCAQWLFKQPQYFDCAKQRSL